MVSVALGLSGLAQIAGVAPAPGASGAALTPSVYVTNGGNATVSEYAPGTSGNSYASTVLPGSSLGLHAPNLVS